MSNYRLTALDLNSGTDTSSSWQQQNKERFNVSLSALAVERTNRRLFFFLFIPAERIHSADTRTHLFRPVPEKYWKIPLAAKPTSQLTIVGPWGLAHIESSGVWGLLICKQICLLSSARRAEKNGPYKPLAFNSPGQVVVAESNRFFAPQASSHRPLYLTRPVTKRQKNSSKFLTSVASKLMSAFYFNFFIPPTAALCLLSTAQVHRPRHRSLVFHWRTFHHRNQYANQLTSNWKHQNIFNERIFYFLKTKPKLPVAFQLDFLPAERWPSHLIAFHRPIKRNSSITHQKAFPCPMLAPAFE